jgi:hypothetical protein
VSLKKFIRQDQNTACSGALARTDARSVHAVLDFFVTFFVKKKSKEETPPSRRIGLSNFLNKNKAGE